MTTQIEETKQAVKRHTVIPFTSRDINCEKFNNQTRLVVNDKYVAADSKAIMETLGIRSNLMKNIFANPAENWDVMRSAINSIDKNKRFAAIVDDNNNLVTLVNGKVENAKQLNFDDRIDRLFNTINDSASHNFQSISFDPSTCLVDINAINTDEIDCGLGDLWNFGTTSTVGLLNQQFKQFFNRLICTNGMTTQQGIAYRQDSASTHIGKQFLKYSSNRDIVNAIKPRVQKLRNARASLYEVNLIADALKKEDKEAFFPNYTNIIQDFSERGFAMKDVSAKRQRYMYTNENLYDVFNLATSLASHQRDVIGPDAAKTLNKAAGDMFAKGPALDFNLIDIYKS